MRTTATLSKLKTALPVLAAAAALLAIASRAQSGNAPAPHSNSGNPNAAVPYSPSGAPASGQVPPTHATPLDGAGKAAAYSGCVQPSPTEKGVFVLNTPAVCAELSGKLATAKLSGHEIQIQGLLTPSTDKAPALIQINSVTSVGKSCSDVCSPRPPHSRGLGGEQPGKEAGTPGFVPSN